MFILKSMLDGEVEVQRFKTKEEALAKAVSEMATIDGQIEPVLKQEIEEDLSSQGLWWLDSTTWFTLKEAA